MNKISLRFMLLSVCVRAALAGAADAWVDRIAGISPDTYVDFPVRAGAALEVLVSNDCADASSSRKPLRLKTPENAEGTVLLGFRRYRGCLSLYLDGRTVHAEPDRPGLIHLLVPAESLPEDRGDAYVQSLAPFAFADAFMVAEGDKTGLQSWEKLAGDWTLHAVTGRTVRAEDKSRLSRFPTQARSPNFYCLNGFGTHALVTAGEAFYSHYLIRASLQQNGGTNGIAFLVSDEGHGYTFTAQPNPLTGRLDFILRSGCVAGESAGEFVAGAETELTPGQWYMLEARLTEDEVVCSVDGIPVVRKVIPQPAGGRFGLYCNTLEAHPARFDDVAAETWTGVDFALADDKPNRDSKAAFGATSDPPAAISIRAAIPTGRHVELTLGDDGQEAGPTWRLLCESVAEDGPRLRVNLICRMSDGSTVTNDTWLSDLLPVQTGAESQAREFTFDATAPGFVAGRVDNVTVVLAPVSRPPVGRAGYVTNLAPGSRRGGFLGHPSVTREPSPYTDRFEKNKIFVADQFMRHWASTAGQWLTYTNGTAWYKDDVLNRVSLSFPTIDGIDLRLGVPETNLCEDGRPASTNACDIRVVCADGKLSIFDTAATVAVPLFTLGYPPAQMVGETGNLNVTNTVTLRFDGHRFAFLSATGAVFTCSIPYPHVGRRMFFARHPKFYLGNVLVHREPVLDCLFDESLHDWTINGGTWEIINRFQCYPDWSHMDGENPDSVAALWSKFEIAGDFCATFVCGMRHGGPWYDRVGDFNLTLFNGSTTPSEGYTLKVTDWDPNNSQRWSRLFRNGRLVVRTDVKAAPRRREGNVRTGYEPLLAKGRDVHGAWYTVKFRKLGGHLEAFFDNLPLLSADDPEPLAGGGLGIWTYRSSMVVARVRVTAERIAPRRFAFKPLAATPSEGPAPSPLSGLSNISFNDVPADLLRPELWHAADDVSSPEITFGEEGDETVMTVSSVHGSGSFQSAPILPETTVDKLAGWTFEVARSPAAQFNFVFSLAGQGYTNHYSHVICGSDEHRGPRAIVGQSQVPDATAPDARKKVWTPVTVWIPATGNDPRVERVICEGFGNLQPSDIQQGLHGNAPGAWYAVRRLHPVYRGTPSPDNAGDNAAAFAAEIAHAFDKGKAAKLNSHKVSSSICKTRPTIYWTLPPADNPGLIATVLAAPTNAIRIASSLEWPNPIICVSNVTVNGAGVPFAHVRDSALVIPYARPFNPSASPIVKVSFATGSGRPFTQMIPSSAFARPNGTPERAPVVTGVYFPPSIAASYENFESRTGSIRPYTRENTRRELRYGDAAQSTYLHFHNAGQHSRLSGTFANQFDVARTPLLQFRYRGDEMALVNISPRQNTFFHFSDNYGGQKRPAQLDDEWHTAFCRLTAIDFETRPNFLFQRSQNQLFFTSSHISVPGIPQYHINQTGLFSYFDIDDIALGPAIGPANAGDFRFRAAFDAPDGLGEAQYAVISGDAPYDARPDTERNAIAWTAFTATNEVAPPLGNIANGIHHLLVRALSSGGSPSAVADIPFIYDALPPELSFVLSTNSATGPNDAMLTATIKCGPFGSAPVFTNAVFTANGTKLAPYYAGNVVGKADNSISYAMKWPYLARNVIQACTNGATVRFRVENVRDGAGNVAAAPAEATYKIDYASDKTPPMCSPSLFNIGVFKGKGGFPMREAFFENFGPGIEAGRHVATDVDGRQTQTLMLKVAGDPNQKDAPHRMAVAGLPFQNWITPTNRWLLLRARVPEKTPAPTGVVFRLAFIVNATPKDAKTPAKNNRYVLEVPASSQTNEASRIVGLRGDTDFTPGKWVELAIDVGAFLCSKAGAPGASFKIERLQLVLPHVKGGALELDAAAVMKNVPADKRSLDFNAYDVSGIDGLYIGDTKIADGGRIMLDKLYEKCGSKLFADIDVRDRAGNVTPLATIVPLPPRD